MQLPLLLLYVRKIKLPSLLIRTIQFLGLQKDSLQQIFSGKNANTICR